MIISIIELFDKLSGFLTFIVTVTLALITCFYAAQASRQAKDTHEILEKSDIQMKNAALNYVYLINSEMSLHKTIFINFIYNKTTVDLDKIELYASYSNYFKNLNTNIWDEIKKDIPTCFPSNMMQELVGYYYGVRELLSNSYTDVQELEIVKDQLTFMYKCIDLAESEYKIKLRTQETFEFDNCKIKVDKQSGNLLIEK